MFTHASAPEDQVVNPLDSLETVFDSYNWVFSRMNDEELFVKLTGKSTEYDVYFVWDEALNLLRICAEFNIEIPEAHHNTARRSIMHMNDNLHIGSFSFQTGASKPIFSYSTLMKHLHDDQARLIINDIIDLCLAECEKYSTAFSMLHEGQTIHKHDLDLALMEAQGQS